MYLTSVENITKKSSTVVVFARQRDVVDLRNAIDATEKYL